MSGILTSAGFFLARYLQIKMSIKSTIAALAASPFLFAGAAFAGPYVNLEANGSYPDGSYESGALEAQIGYEGETEGGLGYYVSVGPTVGHTEAADEFGDVEIAGYLGGTYDKFYAEVYGVTADDDIDLAGKVGVKFTF
tara:strand:- start:27 stop:443 length:417 start_codon:yes stop_codon:yes gene_type:complete